MVIQDRYASILNTLIEMAKERGLNNPGSDEASVCYDLIEAAISEAEVWDIPLEEIGLHQFDASRLLQPRQDQKAA